MFRDFRFHAHTDRHCLPTCWRPRCKLLPETAMAVECMSADAPGGIQPGPKNWHFCPRNGTFLRNVQDYMQRLHISSAHSSSATCSLFRPCWRVLTTFLGVVRKMPCEQGCSDFSALRPTTNRRALSSSNRIIYRYCTPLAMAIGNPVTAIKEGTPLLSHLLKQISHAAHS